MTYIKHKSEESMEDYLETILLLHNKNNKVRSIDIVSELGYSKPSVSIAMKGLREKGLITMDDCRWCAYGSHYSSQGWGFLL